MAVGGGGRQWGDGRGRVVGVGEGGMGMVGVCCKGARGVVHAYFLLSCSALMNN